MKKIIKNYKKVGRIGNERWHKKCRNNGAILTSK